MQIAFEAHINKYKIIFNTVKYPVSSRPSYIVKVAMVCFYTFLNRSNNLGIL